MQAFVDANATFARLALVVCAVTRAARKSSLL